MLTFLRLIVSCVMLLAGALLMRRPPNGPQVLRRQENV